MKRLWKTGERIVRVRRVGVYLHVKLLATYGTVNSTRTVVIHCNDWPRYVKDVWVKE